MWCFWWYRTPRTPQSANTVTFRGSKIPTNGFPFCACTPQENQDAVDGNHSQHLFGLLRGLLWESETCRNGQDRVVGTAPQGNLKPARACNHQKHPHARLYLTPPSHPPPICQAGAMLPRKLLDVCEERLLESAVVGTEETTVKLHCTNYHKSFESTKHDQSCVTFPPKFRHRIDEIPVRTLNQPHYIIRHSDLREATIRSSTSCPRSSQSLVRIYI